MRTRRPIAFGLAFLALLGGGCRLMRLERKLGGADAEFLSKVRYIVSAEERRIFLELPDPEKPGFIDDFWRRRDPDPDTEENEFKTEYFKRIAEATRLFISEGIPGWMTDRGRIFVLFGAPMDRIVDSMNPDPALRCREIWYYGDFPVVFVDTNCVGHFSLVTYDLTPISGLNLAYMHALNQAQADVQKPPAAARKAFDFRVRLEGVKSTSGGLEARVIIEVAYEAIWFKSVGSRMATNLEAIVEVQDAEKKTVRQWKRIVPFDFEERELRNKWGTDYTLEIPVAIDAPGDLERLGSGAVWVVVTLTNTTGNETAKRQLELRPPQPLRS